jgi:nucleotide-binding universal stress UspA family protein
MNEIVVGLGSVSTHDHVLDLALAEAERTSAPVRVVRCIAPYPWAATNGLGYPLSPVTVPDLTELRRASQEEVEAVVEKALARRLEPTAVAISAEILDGDPGRILTDLSAKASLTVVGGQCHGRLQRALLGSTTTYVLHHAQGPVLVVPDSTSGEAVTRVVVGLDGSESSRAALVHAVALATDLPADGCVRLRPHVRVGDRAVARPARLRRDPARWAGVAPDGGGTGGTWGRRTDRVQGRPRSHSEGAAGRGGTI